MSHQPYQQPPAWGPPPAPRPPKKKGLRNVAIGCGSILALIIGLAALGTALGDNDDKDEAGNKPSATSSAPGLTDEQRASIDAAVGLPPKPDAATRKAYLDALDAIDPRIAKQGKDDQTVDRGRNQCSSIKNDPDNRDKQIQLTLDRFTITTRLPDISTTETGGKVLDAVHKHLCPDF